MINRKNMKPTITIYLAILLAACNTQKKQETDNNSDSLKNIPQAVGNDLIEVVVGFHRHYKIFCVNGKYGIQV